MTRHDTQREIRRPAATPSDEVLLAAQAGGTTKGLVSDLIPTGQVQTYRSPRFDSSSNSARDETRMPAAAWLPAARGSCVATSDRAMVRTRVGAKWRASNAKDLAVAAHLMAAGLS